MVVVWFPGPCKKFQCSTEPTRVKRKRQTIYIQNILKSTRPRGTPHRKALSATVICRRVHNCFKIHCHLYSYLIHAPIPPSHLRNIRFQNDTWLSLFFAKLIMQAQNTICSIEKFLNSFHFNYLFLVWIVYLGFIFFVCYGGFTSNLNITFLPLFYSG